MRYTYDRCGNVLVDSGLGQFRPGHKDVEVAPRVRTTFPQTRPPTSPAGGGVWMGVLRFDGLYVHPTHAISGIDPYSRRRVRVCLKLTGKTVGSYYEGVDLSGRLWLIYGDIPASFLPPQQRAPASIPSVEPVYEAGVSGLGLGLGHQFRPGYKDVNVTPRAQTVPPPRYSVSSAVQFCWQYEGLCPGRSNDWISAVYPAAGTYRSGCFRLTGRSMGWGVEAEDSTGRKFCIVGVPQYRRPASTPSMEPITAEVNSNSKINSDSKVNSDYSIMGQFRGSCARR